MDTHPAKVELRARLSRLESLGCTRASVEELVRCALVLRFDSPRTVALSGDRDEFLSLLICGVLREEIVSTRGSSIVRFVAPGEIFRLPRSPEHAQYFSRLVVHPSDDGAGHAVVALWGRESVENALGKLPTRKLIAAMTDVFESLLHTVETQRFLFELRLDARIEFLLQRLSEQFGRPHQDGVLIDLRITNQDLGGLAAANRCSVNRALQRLGHRGIVRREDSRLILMKKCHRAHSPSASSGDGEHTGV